MITYARRSTGLQLVDPYRDFLSEGEKLWPQVKTTAREENLLDHMRRTVAAARVASIQLFIVTTEQFLAALPGSRR